MVLNVLVLPSGTAVQKFSTPVPHVKMPWQAQGQNKTNFWAAPDIKKVISRPPRTHHFTLFQHELLSPLR